MRFRSEFTSVFIFLGVLLCWSVFTPATVVIKTPAEAANYAQYTQYVEMSQFLSRLDRLFPEIRVRLAGRTLAARNHPAEDLFLCIITEEGIDAPPDLNRAKPTLLIVAAKHGNEQSAKEAALRMIRDLVAGDLRPLLKKLNFLVLPTANPYGNYFDQRRNVQELDLNRDQVKLESPEAETINRIFRTWMPEASLDVHEKGYDYYQVSIGCVSNINIAGSLQEFSRQRILPEIAKKLDQEKITFFEYLITQRMGIDSSAGVNYAPADLESRENMKRYSTTDLNDGRNSPGIYQTLSFIQEGASRHDLKTLQERTHYQYFGIRFMAESIAANGAEINSLVRDLRADLLAKAAVYSAEDLIHLRMKYARDPEQPTLTIKRFVRTPSAVRGVLKTDKKAGDTILASDLIRQSLPGGYKIEDEVVKNWFPSVEPVLSVVRPLGYIVPAEHQDIIETLLRHKLELNVFTRDFQIETEVYQVTDIIPAEYDYLPPQKIAVEKKRINSLVKKGDMYISCTQAGANLIPCLLEPQSQYGFIRYWMFKLVPEKGGLFPLTRVITDKEMPVVPYKKWRRI